MGPIIHHRNDQLILPTRDSTHPYGTKSKAYKLALQPVTRPNPNEWWGVTVRRISPSAQRSEVPRRGAVRKGERQDTKLGGLKAVCLLPRQALGEPKVASEGGPHPSRPSGLLTSDGRPVPGSARGGAQVT